MINRWTDENAYYPDLIIIHSVDVLNYHIIPYEGVHILKSHKIHLMNKYKEEKVKTYCIFIKKSDHLS